MAEISRFFFVFAVILRSMKPAKFQEQRSMALRIHRKRSIAFAVSVVQGSRRTPSG